MKKFLLTFLVLLLVSCSSAEPVANDIVEESPLEVQTDDTTTTSTEPASPTNQGTGIYGKTTDAVGEFIYNTFMKGDLERGLGADQYMDRPLTDSEKEEYLKIINLL